MSLLDGRRGFVSLLAALTLTGGTGHLFADTAFSQMNLTSDIPGMAQNTDPNLKNPWGVSFAPTSPFWVSNQGSGNSTLYDGKGAIVPLVVSTPPGSPTGQVFNGTGQFTEPGGKSSSFIFATLGGQIDGWNSGDVTTAATLASKTGAVYTGLALANNGSANYLYAANARGGIDVFDSNFKPATLSGSFVDPSLPKGYTPYDVKNIGGNLYVEYSQGRTTGAGLGVVSEFDANGHFIREVAAGGALDAPWGITMAPAGFGKFGGDLLVGNFGNGEINAFDPTTGALLGTLEDGSDHPIVNDGLWSLSFRSAAGFNPDSLYFTAGINGEKDGLFGSITPTPEPSTFFVAALGFFAMFAFKRARKSPAGVTCKAKRS